MAAGTVSFADEGEKAGSLLKIFADAFCEEMIFSDVKCFLIFRNVYYRYSIENT